MNNRTPKFVCIIIVVLLLFVEYYNNANSNNITYVDWFDKFLLENDDFPINDATLPFSFNYGDKTSSSLLANVRPTLSTQVLSDVIRKTEIKWTCKDGLIVTLCVKTYLDYPAIEYIAYISYDGQAKSQVITNLYGLDFLFYIKGKDKLIIHTNKGDDCTKYSYQPYDIILNKGQSEIFYPSQGGIPSGKSTTGPRGWPYWNIQNGDHGWILAIGWPGTWQNEIRREDFSSFRVRTGQQTFRAVLYQGETIRTPLICVLPWESSDIETSQNIWRHFYLDHIIPKFKDVPEEPVTQVQTAQMINSISYVQKYIDAGIKPRICWTDAGWYSTNTGNWMETGEWELDPNKYPNGISPFSSWAHQQGMESLLWFEPERVLGDNYLSNKHQDWLLSVPNWTSQILNLGNQQCLEWLIDHIDGIINANGLDWYREDMNGSGPYLAWVQSDSKLGVDRQGITENFYVQGHLALWDSLKQRHPSLHIDACASGGRRNDLETMHRAVPLLRSDYQLAEYGDDYISGNQAHTWALSSWLPYQGSSAYEYEPYKFRSFYLPCYGMGSINDERYDAIVQGYTECKAIQPMLLYGDFWPLTPYGLDSDEWIAWQFNRAENGNGCIQTFRREKCNRNIIRVKLRGLDAKSLYIFKSFDSKEQMIILGRKLMRRGLRIKIADAPGSSIIVYEKVS